MKDARFHIVCLEALKIETYDGKKIRPVKTFSLDELGITYEQAKAVCDELYGCKTIAAWLTEGTKNDKPIAEY